jgi:riboflavin kinase / FMN adenylyltransferase
MRIYESVEEFKTNASPIAFTIGNFDGVHRGHVALLRYAKEIVGLSGEVVVLTFTNHPSEIVRADRPRDQQLCTLDEKIGFLAEAGVDAIILVPFTVALADLSPLSFIQFIRKWVPFTHIVLGHDAKLGKNREGTREKMESIAKECDFSMHYMPEYRVNGEVVSSSRIRELIRLGKKKEANVLLGRTF